MAENGVSNKEGKIPGKLGRDLQFNLELDVSEALTGLKALQREAKQALREIKALDKIYINEGAALYIKGRLAYGIHPDNLTNNLNALNEGRMNFDWGVVAGIAGIEMDKEPKSTGILNAEQTGKVEKTRNELINDMERIFKKLTKENTFTRLTFSKNQYGNSWAFNEPRNKDISEYKKEELIDELKRRGDYEGIHFYTLEENTKPLVIRGKTRVITID